MYGGKDYSKVQLNSSTDATMQGGSTFKVFGLLAALQKDISTKTRYAGYSPQYFPQFKDSSNARGRVKNFGNEQFGKIDLRRALAHSVNTVFAQLNIELAAPGTSATGVRDAAILAGPAEDHARAGHQHDQHLRHRLAARHRHGQRLRDHRRAGAEGDAIPHHQGDVRGRQHRLQGQEAADAGLRQEGDGRRHGRDDARGDRGHRRARSGLGRPAAGKTGTTTENKAVWFDGFTPQLSAAVGIYQGDGTKTITVDNIGEVTGGTIPVEIWTAFMKGALQGQKVIDFPPRAGLGDSTLPPPPRRFRPRRRHRPRPPTTDPAHDDGPAHDDPPTSRPRHRRPTSDREAGPPPRPRFAT